MAMTRSAPSQKAHFMANSPTGPQPHTATVSPGWIWQFSAAMLPVGKTSARNTACSSVTPAESFVGYGPAWANVSNTPFREYKLSMFLGGVRDPLIVSWPQGFTDRGAIRQQFVHTIDITPTVLEVTGIQTPTTFEGVPQMPIHGKSILQTFRDSRAPNPVTKTLV